VFVRHISKWTEATKALLYQEEQSLAGFLNIYAISIKECMSDSVTTL